jgi:RNase P/RNase MRP subunit p29
MATAEAQDPFAGKHVELVAKYSRAYDGVLRLGRHYRVARSTKNHYWLDAGDSSVLTVPKKHFRLVDAVFGEGL